MTPQLLQQALDALDAALSDDQPYIERSKAAIAALREALNAPEPEPVALESVHLTRDTRGMCVVRVNGRIAIRDNGDIIDHMATLEWFAAPPAAPASAHRPLGPAGPADMAHYDAIAASYRAAPAAPVPDALVEAVAKAIYCEWRRDAGYVPWVDGGNSLKQDDARKIARAVVSSAAPVVPLTDEQIRSMWKSSEFRGNGGQVDWFCEGIRAAEAHHGITGASK